MKEENRKVAEAMENNAVPEGELSDENLDEVAGGLLNSGRTGTQSAFAARQSQFAAKQSQYAAKRSQS